MKNIILLVLLLPAFALAQNPFDTRTSKNPQGKRPSIDAELIDGRKSNQPNFLSPSYLTKANLENSKAIKYRIKYESAYGLPVWLDIYRAKPTGGLGVAEMDEEYSLQTVLSDLPQLFLWDENTKLTQQSVETDDLGITHIRYIQQYKGIPINGGIWMLHTQDNQILSGNGRIYPSQDLDVANTLSASEALLIANNYVAQNHHEHQVSSFAFIDRTPKYELVIDYELTDELKAKLVYKIEVRPTDLHVYEVYVDAKTGEVIKTLDLLCSIDGPKTATATDLNNQSRTLNTYQKGTPYYLIDASKSMFVSGQTSTIPNDPEGAIWTINANNTDATSVGHVSSNNNTWSDKSSVSAHYNAGLAYDYFKNTFNRNSINGSGGTIISVVNVTDNGSSMENAYWNGQAMFYGNGGSAFKPLAGALDVAGHELTHGVVSNSANLEYKGQSGAINESMADIFGAMIDRDDWKMGEDVVKTTVFKSGALRDLQNPHNGGTSLSNNGYQPDKMSEYYNGTQDNGGVHINSGIVNKAYYLIATAIGKDKAEKIYYRALTVYLTSKSQFLDLRYAVEKSATDLYSTTELNAVKTAFDGVEIFDPNAGSGGGSGGSTGGTDIPANSGTENIISVDLNTSDANTIYKSTTTPDGWQALSQRIPKRKASVTDKGDFMYYVANNNILYRTQLTSPFTETQLSNDLWDNAAISKNGKLLAAVTTEVDSSIWVYNFDLSSWKRFQLYNPTYTQGVNGGNVLYADAIEFDNTGQFILYDARNIIESSFGQDIDYWDVGVIRVWDNTSSGWGDGKIDKIFTQLPEDISIGNATYAKNSPYIIAFDYIDANAGEYAVLGTNTITNETGVIFEQSDLGYPNFSNKDDKIIFDATTQTGDKVIAVQALATTKIEAKSGASASVLITEGKWGIWYANGTRNLLSDKKDILTFAFPSLSTQPQGNIVGSTITVEVPGGTDLSSLSPTFTYSADAIVTVNSVKQTSGVEKQNFSSDVIYKVTAQDGTSKNYLVKVSIQAGINEVLRNTSIYPNPSSSQIWISSDVHIDEVKIYTTDGKELITTSNPNAIDISRLATGIYFVEIQTGLGKFTKRFNKI